MKMFGRLFRHNMTLTLREKTALYWTLLFPILLCTLFYFGFSGLSNPKEVSFKVGADPNYAYRSIVENIDVVSLDIIEPDEAASALREGKVDAYIKADGTVEAARNSITVDVVKSIQDTVRGVGELKLRAPLAGTYMGNVRSVTGRTDPTLIAFYSLVAMVSLYSLFSAIYVSGQVQPNLSPLGARQSVSPLRKGIFVLAGLSSNLLVNIVANTMLILFMNYVLAKPFFTNFAASYGLVILGNLLGSALGLFVGCLPRMSEGAKTGLGITITLTLSFLSGMMVFDIRALIKENAPIINQLNPIAHLTDELFRINVLGLPWKSLPSILLFGAYTIILLLGATFFLSKKSHKSI